MINYQAIKQKIYFAEKIFSRIHGTRGVIVYIHLRLPVIEYGYIFAREAPSFTEGISTI